MQARNCQNCKKDFTIEPNDFSFYEKIKVPPPTFCPWCRFIRRMAWRNERTLYKRNCDLCKKSMIATYPADTAFPVYCIPCWHGDGWDPTSHGQDYDFGKPFFEQYKELQNKVPRFNLWQRDAVNSEYANLVGEARNVYLSVSVVLGSENVFYSKAVDASFNIVDSLNIKNSDGCYENIEGDRNYNSQYLLMCRNTIDSFFLVDCVNCSNCFMSSNLRNKQFYFRNKQLTKEEYFSEVEKLALSKRSSRKKLIQEFDGLLKNAIYRFANIVNSVNSSGHNLLNAKNCKWCFDAYDAEDLKYSYRGFISKDSMDFDYGLGSELMYEYTTGANHDYNVKFSYSANGHVTNADYTAMCIASSNLFGCISVRNKDYVILNKQYPKKEYGALREKIVKHMNDMPYVDKRGLVYKYGEFFPIEVGPYAYNETPAIEFEPLSKEEGLGRGYRWQDPAEKTFKVTIDSKNIPNDISEVKDSILEEVLECAGCKSAFRITQGELQFYRQRSVPLPDKCPNCRYMARFASVPLPKLFKRTCMKCGQVEFETPYPPGRSEKIYCESCYNKEVY